MNKEIHKTYVNPSKLLSTEPIATSSCKPNKPSNKHFKHNEKNV